MSNRWLIAVMLAVLPAVALAASEGDVCMANAGASLQAMVRGDFSTATQHFSPADSKALPPAKLAEVWRQVQLQMGAYRDHGVPYRQLFQGRQVVVTPLRFANAPLDFLVDCDAQERITLFYFAQPSAVEARGPVKPHTEADGVRVEPLAVPSPLGPLRGALTLPAGKGPFPGVVLVAGSGPNDLDETVDGSKPFRDVADGLAKAGIASLRYDKRTLDYGAKTAANPGFTIDDEVTDDALTALHLLARQKQVDPNRVFVLGHSLGAMLAPRIAARDPKLAGVIMLAAPARPLLEVTAQQLRDVGPRQGLSKQKIATGVKAMAEERELLARADPKRPPTGMYGPFPQSEMLSLHDYHQVAVAEKLKLPMLFLQGGGDFQVSPKNDFDAWKHALADQPNVTFHLYPGLSHLFTPAGKTLTIADYAKPAHVDPEVIRNIATWIKAQPSVK